MPLPHAISYERPLRQRVNRAPWQIDPARAVLLVHDMQRYFVRPYAADCPAYVEAVDGTARLLEQARRVGVPVVFTAQPGAQDPASRGLLTGLWGPGIGASAADVDIIDPLRPLAGEQVLVKHRYSAFVRSPLEEWLAAEGRDQLVVTGIYAHIGVQATALDALMRDIEPFVPEDAVADFGAIEHDRALDQVASTGGVVTSVDRLLEGLGVAIAPPALGSPEAWLAPRLADLLGDPAVGLALVADPSSNLFESGLDSLRCFTLLDELADHGIDVDFGELAADGTVGFLLDRMSVLA
ncbi:isochorismatase family protein [Nocardioides sp. W7]|uniref:isochorismatase family protein n=1 Tax=Nocardioides sp. W7 TaxID=2931390 RepID=UPI001FD05463|nr:isochorismatase family protein [Nocardioides sp. W7]